MKKSDSTNHFEAMEEDVKLRLLRKAAPARAWESLDEKLQCALCESVISGRQITITFSRDGRPQLHCPTRRCKSTPSEWVRPGDPLISEDAWREWLRLFDTSDGIMAVRNVPFKALRKGSRRMVPDRRYAGPAYFVE